ncbi:MAG: M28 family peptidase [Phycisphaeraceae bacterium]|nr:M28 family peptidase [Phycisphaeraceae bacterium]
MNPYRISLVLVLWAVPASAAFSAPPSPMASHDDAVARYREHVTTLANPFMEGRGSGTRGNELAADYIEFWFRQFGLAPAFPVTETAHDGTEVVTPRGSFRQSFEFGRDTVVAEQSLAITRATDDSPVLFADAAGDTGAFQALAVSGSASLEAPVVFVGYGIESGPPGHESFSSFGEGDDVAGKVVLVLRFEPLNAVGKSAFTDGGEWSPSAALYPRLAALAKRGAAAILVAAPPGVDDPRSKTIETAASTRRLGRPLDIPVMMLSTQTAEALVRAGDEQGRSLAALRALADAGNGVIPLNGVTAKVLTRIDRPARSSANVAGVLAGKGSLAKEYVVIGAHFDHLGDGSLGGSRLNEEGPTHPGADDNASGTAGMLLLAERIASEYAALPETANARSILFMGFSGEEIGLVGSRYFVRNSPLEAASIYAMLNMDMIGRLRDSKLEVNGTGTADGFDAILKPLFDSSGLDIKILPGGRGPSDHASFYAGGIPVLFFFTGFHPEYHTPRDVSRLINFEGGVQVADLVQKIATTLAMRHDGLPFRETEARAPVDHGALPGADPAAGSSVSGTRIRFGIMPDSYGDTDPGVPVGDVFPGTSAADAGIKKGDRLMKWNGELIDSVEAWTEMLKQHKPGDVVTVTVDRDGKEMVLPVTLRARSSGRQ